MQNDGDDKDWDEKPHPQFTEIAQEHEDAVVSVEANMATANDKS